MGAVLVHIKVYNNIIKYIIKVPNEGTLREMYSK
jgi:hypothetical protein